MKIIIEVPLLALILVSASGISNATIAEKNLLIKLLENYNDLERPVNNKSDAVPVKFGIALRSIVYVAEKEGTITTNTWLRMVWYDSNLRWNPEDHDGISYVRIPPSRIWKPDIHAYNSDHDWFDGTFETKSIVYNHGDVLFIPPAAHKTFCPMKFTYYPFEELKCNFMFGSWTIGGNELNLTLWNDLDFGDMTDYIENAEWDVKAFPAKRNVKYYKCCPDEPYIDITFTLHLQRKGNLILRSTKLINWIICLMVVLSFVVSPSSGQKTVAGMIALAFNTWMISSVNSVLPANHDSILGWYFERLCELVFSSIIVNLLIMSLSRLTFPMPAPAKRLLLFMDTTPSFFRSICPKKDPYAKMNSGSQSLPPNNERSTDTRNLVSADSDEGTGNNDWVYLASILDRLFLVVYTLCIFIYITVLFPSFN